MWRRERSKAGEKKKIGFTLRIDAKIKYLKWRVTKKSSSLAKHNVIPRIETSEFN